jgi:FkbM family methyltransferase
VILNIFWIIRFYILRFFKSNIVRSRYGINLYSDFSDKTFRFYHIGSYGFFYSEFLKNYSSNFFFIDIGANRGLYSILASKNPNCEKVFSFEPFQMNYELLKKNLILNNCEDKCNLYHFAVSDKNEEIKTFFNKNHSGSGSMKPEVIYQSLDTEKINTVNNKFLNSLFSLKFQNYVLKIDVEGLEHIVLKEIFKCDFSKFISNIYYEVNECWQNPIVIEELLRDNGFCYFKKIGNGNQYDIMATK